MIVKIIAALYLLGAAGLLFSGMILPALVFGGSAVMAWRTGQWWPLVVGFVLGWVLRLAGLDPGWRKRT